MAGCVSRASCSFSDRWSAGLASSLGRWWEFLRAGFGSPSPGLWLYSGGWPGARSICCQKLPGTPNGLRRPG